MNEILRGLSRDAKPPQEQEVTKPMTDVVTRGVAMIDKLVEALLKGTINKTHVSELMQSGYEIAETLSIVGKPGYESLLNHDLSPYLTATASIQQALRLGRELDVEKQKTALDGTRHIWQTLPYEFKEKDVPLEMFPLADVFDDLLKYLPLVSRAESPERALEIASCNELIVLSQSDILFRLLYNVIRNGQTANENAPVRVKATTKQDGIRITIEDAGAGIADYLQLIGLRTSNRNISLKKILERSRGQSGFAKSGKKGSGLGFVIINSMADLIQAKVSFKNPKYTDHGIVYVDLPGKT